MPAESATPRWGIWQIREGADTGLAVGPSDTAPIQRIRGTLRELLAESGTDWRALAAAATAGEVPPNASLVAPVDCQEVWAAGVTFPRSHTGRHEETLWGPVYDAVYSAERPELFFKSVADRVRGPGESIGIRADSEWNVPEPEIALLVDRSGQVVAMTLGNDVSSRTIEGENPLYLPQAKVYQASCALGPCWVPVNVAPSTDSIDVTVRILRSGATEYEGRGRLRDIRRSLSELVDWLFRSQEFPAGVVLLTGTSVVPPREVTLLQGDTVEIQGTGLGTLRNPVEVVGVAGRRSGRT